MARSVARTGQKKPALIMRVRAKVVLDCAGAKLLIMWIIPDLCRRKGQRANKLDEGFAVTGEIREGPWGPMILEEGICNRFF